MSVVKRLMLSWSLSYRNTSFKDDSGRKYKWKGNVAGHGTALEVWQVLSFLCGRCAE